MIFEDILLNVGFVCTVHAHKNKYMEEKTIDDH